MEPLGSRFRVVQNVETAEVVEGVFAAALHDRGLTRLRHDAWPTVERDLETLGEPLFLESREGHVSGLWERKGTLIRLTLSGNWCHVRAAASTQELADEAIAQLRTAFPLPDASSSQEVPVTFWTYTAHGPMPSVRTIAVPEWAEISANYAASTREQLDAVMTGFRPAHGGQLVLWHGDAGTGKTFALRALAWEWRDWCQLHYIVDPDTFFGQHADYLMNVLMQSGGPMVSFQGGWAGSIGFGAPAYFGDGDVADEGEDEREAPWRLLVLEDTGELLTPDAKSVIGQGLSRFLNVVDGLIGQGLRILVLVTTNEEIRALHPAVARPGRAAANIKFAQLGRDESAAWLAQHELPEAPPGAMTLASLYALLDGRADGDPTPSVGFGESAARPAGRRTE